MIKLAGVALSVLLLSVLGFLTQSGNFQNAFALTPVADLTGQWSGFAQVSWKEIPCETTGKVNGFLNKMKTSYMESFHLFQQAQNHV